MRPYTKYCTLWIFGSEDDFQRAVSVVDWFIVGENDSVVDNRKILPLIKDNNLVTTCDHAKHGVDYMEKLAAALAAL